MVFCYQNCSSDREKLLKFEAEGREFQKFFSITRTILVTKYQVCHSLLFWGNEKKYFTHFPGLTRILYSQGTKLKRNECKHSSFKYNFLDCENNTRGQKYLLKSKQDKILVKSQKISTHSDNFDFYRVFKEKMCTEIILGYYIETDN